MKKFLLLAAPIISVLFSSNNAKAQATASTGSVNMSVQLQAAVAITLNTNSASFVFDTPSKYADGITLPTQTGAFTVSSSRPYTIVATTAANDLAGTGSNVDKIPFNAIEVAVVPTGGSFSTATALPATAGSTANLVGTTTATLSQAYDIQYSIPAAKAHTLLGKNLDTYTSTLLYTITAL
ncbi:hypothetical protein [Solitalea koreensis]|uniref:Uncharacterized protein n=1 Tax=Solitalea koreensis TaxID=543615 RepID=A0A521C3I0_9SPHI|nr:hypothetical protein [Solitalea koreensis]SMO53954.1 hypothetical protein SAMN06265350_103183 [Solitalea koreensis]